VKRAKLQQAAVQIGAVATILRQLAPGIFCCLLLACAERTPEPAAPAQAERATVDKAALAAEFHRFLADNYAQDMAQQPRTASRRGVDTDNRRWNQYSETYFEQRRRQWEQRLAALDNFDPAYLSPADALSWKLYRLELERSIAADAFRHHNYVISHYSGAHVRVPTFLANYHTVGSVADAEDYIARLKDVPRLFGEVIEQIDIRTRKGIFLPDWSYALALESIEKALRGEPFSDGPASALWQDFSGKLEALSLATPDRARLEGEARSALLEQVQPAYMRLSAALREQAALASAAAGAWKHPDGKAFYAERLAYYTTTDLSADEIHELGLEEVARVQQEMRAIMTQVDFDGSLQEFMEFVRTDSRFYLDNTEAGRARYLEEARAYIDAMRAALPTAFGILPRAPLVVKRVEPYRENSSASAFYQTPPEDGSQPGIYYVNLLDVRSQPLYRMESLAYHEGVPGHHMQRSITVELEDLPAFQRYASFTAYTEGWALYAEQLGKEMGFYTDPYSDFGRLSMELWRAVRLVVDTGLHHKGWTMEQAVDYHVQNTPYARITARKAMERYAVRPGQATAYMIGKLKILELREAAKARLGERFDIRAFHDEVLKDGPVSLAILEDKIQRWVAALENRES
jgi:uncharacterized protein (DUF885 family)